MPATLQKLAQGARSRERLLEAITDLVARGGYAGTGVDAIGQRAGVVKSALYWHFGSKEGLLVAALERAASEWLVETRAALEMSGSPPERLCRLLEALHRLFVERPRVPRLLLVSQLECAEWSYEIRSVLREVRSRILASIARGLTPPSGPAAEEVAGHILQSVHGAFLDFCGDHDPERLMRSLRTLQGSVAPMLAGESRAASPSAA